MNKRKKVAWRKHRATAKKIRDQRKAEAQTNPTPAAKSRSTSAASQS